mmetsp:Transcript_1370/g.2517  ORF Transcript_1370/g.2517 Transcript_1370/m.2517 type:complete len:113 (-) Transcript_1370:150-488(-)
MTFLENFVLFAVVTAIHGLTATLENLVGNQLAQNVQLSDTKGKHAMQKQNTAPIVGETTTSGTSASASTSTPRLVKERGSFLGMMELSCNSLLSSCTLVVVPLLLINETGWF